MAKETTLDPIDFAAVGRAVADIDWSFRDADTRQLTHGIHRYSGKFIPQIAEAAIELLTKKGEAIVDPYCGSGTALLESGRLGRHASGIDMSPLATLISRAKCSRVDTTDLVDLVEQMEAATPGSPYGDGQSSLFESKAPRESAEAVDPRYEDPWFHKWFQRPVLDDLSVIWRAIGQLPEETRRVASVAFSDILRRCSNAHSGYPNVMYNKRLPEKPSPGPLFLGRLREVVAAVAELSRLDDYTEPAVREGDAATMPFDSETMDAVITHPPYIGSVPYAEYGLLSLRWLGHDPKSLDKQLTGGRRQSRDVVQRFEASYCAMFRESQRVLRPGRGMFILVGNPVVKGERIALNEMSVEGAAAAGLDLVSESTRPGINRRSNQMGEEHVLVFRKPS